MVIYTREEKVLIIPEGEGCGCQGGGGHPSKNCEREKREAYESGYTAGLHADCGEAIDEAYNSGYTAGLEACSGSTDCSSAITEAYQSGYTEGYNQGQADCPECSGSTCNIQPLKAVVPQFDNYPVDYQMDIYPDAGYDGLGRVSIDKMPLYQQGYEAGLEACSGSSCTLEEGELDISDFWDGGPTVVYPSTADGFSQFTVEDTNGSYAYKHYMDGYNDGLAQCSGSTDCSSAVTEAYQSGYTQGQADCDCTESYEIGYQDGYADGRESIASGCPMQEKFIRVSTIEESVTPDYGYAGLSEVHINAENFYNTAYNDGYAAGLEDCSGSTDCSSAITEAYQSGYTEGYIQGQADCPQCSGGTCNLTDTWIDLMDGDDFEGQGVDYYVSAITPNYDGWYKVHIQDKDYGQSKYDEGYTDGHTSGYSEGYNAAITANCGSAIEEAYESGYTEGYDAAGTKIYSSSKDIYFDELTWVDVENSAAYGEEDTIMIDYKWGNTVTGSNTIVLFSNESDDPTAANPPSPTTPSFSILMHTAGLSITTDDGQGNRQIWTGLNRSAQLNHSYRLIVQTYSYTSSVTIKAALIDLTSGQITTGSTNGAFHFTGATSLSYCINGYRNTVDGVYEGMNSDWYLGGIKIFDNTGRMKHNYHFLNGCISDVVNDLETGYEAKYYDNSVETYYPLTGVEETMRFFY